MNSTSKGQEQMDRISLVQEAITPLFSLTNGGSTSFSMILVVNTKQFALQDLDKLLIQYKVAIPQSKEEALDLVKQQSFDIMLLDENQTITSYLTTYLDQQTAGAVLLVRLPDLLCSGSLEGSCKFFLESKPNNSLTQSDTSLVGTYD